jgi:anti-sigma factor RsiW
MKCEEAQEFITALVDNELSYRERNDIEVHLKDCLSCRSTYEHDLVLKREIHLAAASVSAPADLRARILSHQSIVRERSNPSERWKGLYWLAKMAPRPAFVLAVLFLLTLPILYLVRPVERPISAAALETHEKILTGSLSFVRASQEEVKERLLRSAEGKLAPMEYDFSVAGLQVAGGLVQEVGGRKVLVTVYEGKGLLLSCYTFFGVEKDAPANAKVFFDPEKGKHFYTFSQGRINGVLQRVGEKICILVSEMPLADLITLARSMA